MGIATPDKNFRTREFYSMLFIVFAMSIVLNASFRGIVHDEAIGSFRNFADTVWRGDPLLDMNDPESSVENIKAPARLIYIVLIALGYALFGKTLLAYHIFPYLVQLLSPALFFLIASRFFRSARWGLIAAFLFIIAPFNLACLNLCDSIPIFVFFFLLLMLTFEEARTRPQWLLLCGIFTSLLILTRFTGGVIFGFLFYGIYVMYRWKPGVPWKWVLASFGCLLGTQGLLAWLFGFPFLYPLYYVPALLQRQADFAISYSFTELTMLAVRIFFYWFFGGKFLAPVLAVFIIAGTFVHLKKRTIHPIALFFPYLGFVLFVYNGRFDAAYIPAATFLVPGFLLIVLSGIQATVEYVAKRIPAMLTPESARRLQRPAFRLLLYAAVFIIVIGGLSRSAYSLLILIEDSMPISTMWRMVKYNPPFPGNPAFQQEYIQLSPDVQIPVMLREQMIKAVRGNFRSWYIHQTSADALDRGLMEQARERADFSYSDEYESKSQWERDRYAIEGTSTLWSDEHSGQIGAFPVGKSASFIYRFDFPEAIDSLTISDLHTQWGVHDVTKMWTSTDGENWTLRHNNWNVHHRKDYYYQFFDKEFDGQTTLFVKYFFKAGDTGRGAHDNRGASLHMFSLFATFVKTS